ncbi:MAG: PAS domain S-box protein [Acidimicrobiia bacterium]|nr:PAS domain S-box protein [Acidimicrobiia bacterium]
MTMDNPRGAMLPTTGSEPGPRPRRDPAAPAVGADLLLDHISDMVTVIGPDRTVRYASPALERILGYHPRDLVGRRDVVEIHPDDRDRRARYLGRALASPGSTAGITMRARHRDGTWRLIETTGTNLTDRPDVAGLLFISRDITERRRLEDQIHQVQKMDSVGSLAGGMAHDINNVLTAILGYGELILARPGLDPAVRDDVLEILTAGRRARTLTSQLLAFTRRHPTEPRLFSVHTLVDDLSRMLRRLIGEHIDLRTVFEPGLWPIRADPAQVEQVVLNLALNARDAMPDGGTLSIATANRTIDDRQADREGLPAGESVVLTVVDTGVGMSDEIRMRAFEPFFTTKEPGKGTGLGLTTCYGNVRQAGGQIRIESAPGQGTTVAVFWPRGS